MSQSVAILALCLGSLTGVAAFQHVPRMPMQLRGRVTTPKMSVIMLPPSATAPADLPSVFAERLTSTYGALPHAHSTTHTGAVVMLMTLLPCIALVVAYMQNSQSMEEEDEKPGQSVVPALDSYDDDYMYTHTVTLSRA